MSAPEPIGWLNTGLPLALLVALAWLLPRVTVPRATRSHGDVACGIGLAALGVLLAGAVLFGLLQAVGGADLGGALAAAPLATGLILLRLSGLAALAWGPVLGLAWLSQAQAVERRRGEDRIRGGRG